MTQHTSQVSVITLAADLPAGALLGGAQGALQAIVSEQGGSWFRALPEFVEMESDDRTSWVSGWRSATTDVRALPSRPNQGGGRFDPTGPVAGMCFQAGTHCGYSADGIAPSAERFTIAVIYRSEDQEGRTLFSIAGQDKSNMLFANETPGSLSVLDREGTLRLKCEAPEPVGLRHALLIVSYEAGKLRVSINCAPPQEASGQVPGLTGVAELFIGCRNHRSGLAKTLGTSRISDVLFWPDVTLLSPAGMPNPPVLSALEDYWRWNR